MPKIATQDLTTAEFKRALKRAKFTHLPSILGDRFRDDETGQDYAGLYAGRAGLLSRRFTVKHLLAQRAARAERPTKAQRKPRTPAKHDEATGAPLL